MKKMFVSVDMEGVAGVSSRESLSPAGWEWTATRRWMTLEAVAAAEAAFDAGYDEVILADGHGNALNIDPDLLPENVRLVRSWPRPLLHMQGAEDPDVVACAFIGYHAEASTPDSAHAHTYSGAAIRSLRLNGELCSEGYLNAALAGELGLPVAFISGDPATVADAGRYAPHAGTCVTKASISQRASSSLPPAQVRGQLKAEMHQALTKPLSPPFRLEGPYVLEVETTTQAAAAMLSWMPTVRRKSGWVVEVSFDHLADAMRFISAVILYTPSGQPAL